MAMFDTYKAAKSLLAAGFDESQAEALVETMAESRGELATKSDLKDLELRLTLRFGAMLLATSSVTVAAVVAAVKIL